MIITFDDSPADLIRLADAAQIAHLQHRVRIAEHGMKLARQRTLRLKVREMLERDTNE